MIQTLVNPPKEPLEDTNSTFLSKSSGAKITLGNCRKYKI